MDANTWKSMTFQISTPTWLGLLVTLRKINFRSSLPTIGYHDHTYRDHLNLNTVVERSETLPQGKQSQVWTIEASRR